MDTDWDELDAEQTLQAARRIIAQADRSTLFAAADPVAEVIEGSRDGDRLAQRLEALQILVAIVHRDLDLMTAEDEPEASELTEMLYDIVEENRAGPMAEAIADALLRESRLSDGEMDPEEQLEGLESVVPSAALSDAAAALARDLMSEDDAMIALWSFALRGNPHLADTVAAVIAEHADSLRWGLTDLLAALVELGPERAAPFLPRVAEDLHTSPHAEYLYAMLGEPLVPHIKPDGSPWVEALIARLKAPWDHTGELARSAIYACPRAPSLWPDLLALLIDDPTLPTQLNMREELLSAVAYGRFPAEPLMDQLVATGVEQQRWLTLLALGEPARGAMQALLETDTLEERAADWLSQVVAML